MKEFFSASRYFVLIIAMSIISCAKKSPMIGKWQYKGGLYNGKNQNSSPDFKLQRQYQDTTFEGFLIDGANPPERFNAGTYKIDGDSLFITSNYSSNPSQLVGKTVKFKFNITENLLTQNGTLPNGMVVEEYWERVE